MNQLSLLLLLPVKRKSGGSHELYRFVDKLSSRINLSYSTLYIVPSSLPRFLYPFLFPIFLCLTIFRVKRLRYDYLVHGFFPLLYLSVFLNPRKNICFIQAKEWLFFNLPILIRSLLRRSILYSLKSQAYLLFSTNKLHDYFSRNASSYLSNSRQFILPVGGYESLYLNSPPCFDNWQNRSFEFTLILRNGWVKHLTAYQDFILYLSLLPNPPSVAVISFISDNSWLANHSFVSLFQPLSTDQFYALLNDTKFFLCLSHYESFGLPCLEAMSHGCIPFVRDNDGVHNFLTSNADFLVFPQDSSPSDLYHTYSSIISLPPSTISKLIADSCSDCRNYIHIASQEYNLALNSFSNLLSL